MNAEQLCNAAISARKSAYCRYSGFSVGAALLCRDGRIFAGCNIENSSYSATVCAERTAIFKAVSEGERDFEAIAVASGGDSPAPPCGVCLQVLSEFCNPDEFVVLLVGEGKTKRFLLSDLLPHPFSLA